MKTCWPTIVHYEQTFELDASSADARPAAAVDFGEGTAVTPRLVWR